MTSSRRHSGQPDAPESSGIAEASGSSGLFAAGPEAPPARGTELCRQCAAGGFCCCITDLPQASLCFPLSLPEWRRLNPRLATREPEASGASGGPEAAWTGDLGEFGELLPCTPDAPSARHTPDAPGDDDPCCVREHTTPEFIRSMRALFPGDIRRLAELFSPGGRHLRLRIRADGSCVFLGARGCRLPRAARPWYCRLFPAWVTGAASAKAGAAPLNAPHGRERIRLFQAEACLVSRRALGVAHGLQLLGTPPETIFFLYHHLREDWGLASRPAGV